jgi:DNA-binding response OmpR family regulator
MTDAQQIIVVDDEPALRMLLEEYLGAHGYAVRTAEGAAEFDRELAIRRPDLVVLDVNMPGEDGFSIARRLRRADPRTGIIMLTAIQDQASRINGLTSGADDYLVKPFEPRELLARVHSVLRRIGAAERDPPIGPAGEKMVRFGSCTLDLAAHRLLAPDGREVPISLMEFELLAVFARHAGQVLSRDRLVELAHGRPLAPGDRSVDIRMTRLRKKLEANPAVPRILRTIRGEGYMYDPGG